MSTTLIAQEQSRIVKKNKGLYGTVELGYLKTFNISSDYVTYPSSDWKLYGKSLRLGFGYFLNPYFSVGLGIGADRYEEPGANTFPVYVDLRAYLNGEPSSPFVFFDIGNSIQFSEAQQKGLLMDAGLGYKFSLGKKISLTASMSYNYKKFPEWIKQLNEESANMEWTDLSRHSLNFKLGLFF